MRLARIPAKIMRLASSALVICVALFLFYQPGDSRAQFPHNQGKICATCHSDLAVGGTIFTDSSAAGGKEGVAVSIIAESGEETALGITDASGNLAASDVPYGSFLVRAGRIISRTWHALPNQGMCNRCHMPGGNATETDSRTFPAMHSRIPPDNNCAHCHHFPASMSYAKLATAGVLAAAPGPPAPPGSQVDFLGRIFPFDPALNLPATVRPDIFAPGYFSLFDVILEVARANGIPIDYHYDPARKTHFIDRIDRAAADYWYHFSYDADGGNSQEIQYRRANRWDELLWRPGVWIRVVSGENLNEIKAEYLEEIQRESAFGGSVIPLVQFNITPSSYRSNPLGSGRVRFVRQFKNVEVTAHNTRAIGHPSPYAAPFQPGVVTALDVLLSLKDQGYLDLVTTVHYSYFAQHYIDSQYVVALGFPGVGTAHSSGRQGFIYQTENGTPSRFPNGADTKLHVTSDILVIHAPDFATWRTGELGVPYYEAKEPAGGLPGDNDRLCLPLPENRGLLTGVAILQEGAAGTSANWILRDNGGSPASVEPGGVNPGRTIIPGHGQLARMLSELFGGNPVNPGGWLEMLGDDPGLSGFFLFFDPALTITDGLDLSSRRVSQFVFPELPPNQEVDIALVNPDEIQSAGVTIRLRDNQGFFQGSAVAASIPPKGRYSGRANALFSPQLLAQGGYLEVSSSHPLSAIEQFGSPGWDIAMLNALDQAGGAKQLFAPQYVHGMGYRSALIIINLENAPTTVTLAWKNGGGEFIGNPAALDLFGKGRAVIADPSVFGVVPPPQGLEGYVVVSSSATRIAGSVRFGDPSEAGLQTALPLVAEARTEVLFGQIADDPTTWFTGLAAVNPNSGPVEISVDAFDSQGVQVGSHGTHPIPAGGRISELLSELVPGLPTMSRGYFRVRAGRPIFSFAVFGLRSLSALAAIPPQIPAYAR